jgi:hypothetical protein
MTGLTASTLFIMVAVSAFLTGLSETPIFYRSEEKIGLFCKEHNVNEHKADGSDGNCRIGNLHNELPDYIWG